MWLPGGNLILYAAGDRRRMADVGSSIRCIVPTSLRRTTTIARSAAEGGGKGLREGSVECLTVAYAGSRSTGQ
jgi:hypothetical protein